MGKPFEKHSRLFALPIATVLSDQKAPIRAAALKTLGAIATACEGLESLVGGFTTALETSNPLQKGTLLGWLVEWFSEHPPEATLDISVWAASIVGSLDDRSGFLPPNYTSLRNLVLFLQDSHKLRSSASL